MIDIRTVFLFVDSASTALAQTLAASQSNREAPIAPPIVKNLDLSDPHSPARWRINGTVQNFEEFGEVFKMCQRPAHVL